MWKEMLNIMDRVGCKVPRWVFIESFKHRSGRSGSDLYVLDLDLDLAVVVVDGDAPVDDAHPEDDEGHQVLAEPLQRVHDGLVPGLDQARLVFQPARHVHSWALAGFFINIFFIESTYFL